MSSQYDGNGPVRAVLDNYPAILRTVDVLALLRISRSTLWRRVRDGEFPQPVRLGGAKSRAVGWRRTDVERWLEALPAASAVAFEPTQLFEQAFASASGARTIISGG